MGAIDGLRERVETVRRQYGALDVAGWGEPGQADAETGERWDRGNVLGHVAEMLPFWTGQVRAVLDGSGDMGRDPEGWAHRRQGIDHLRDEGEEALLRRIDEGLGGLLDVLADMGDADLDRPIVMHGLGPDRESDLRSVMELVLVGHSESHLKQLEELTPTG
jgi:DinB superfamily